MEAWHGAAFFPQHNARRRLDPFSLRCAWYCVFIPWFTTRWYMDEPILGFEPMRWLGAALILFSATVLLNSFARFALQGRVHRPDLSDRDTGGLGVPVRAQSDVSRILRERSRAAIVAIEENVTVAPLCRR